MQISFICDALRNLVQFVQLKKREKRPWRTVAFRVKPATLLKATFLLGYFSRVLNFTNVTKSRNTPHTFLKIY